MDCPAEDRGLRADGSAKGKHRSLLRCGPLAGCAERQRCLDGQAVREPEESLRAFGRNPRDRPGPKGLGRNLFRDEPKPSPARDSISAEVGLGSNVGPHLHLRVRLAVCGRSSMETGR
jgi:hypothetical protein